MQKNTKRNRLNHAEDLTFDFRLSAHARRDMRRYGLAGQDVAVALLFGQAQQLSDNWTYVLTDRALLGSAYEEAASRLRGLSVEVGRGDYVLSVTKSSRITRRPSLMSRSRIH